MAGGRSATTAAAPPALTALPGTPGPGVPAMFLLTAQPHWRAIDFISDLHLSADTPRTFESWAAYMRNTTADAVLLLGDWVEAWVGDDSRFEGFEAQCAEVLTECARHRTVGFMVGNRDFLIGADMLEACGVIALPDPTRVDAFGERVLLTHGDELCLSDTDYQRYRAQVRHPDFQRQFLELPMAARRQVVRQVRQQSEMRKGGGQSPSDWADVDPTAAVAWMAHADTPAMIHGHTHRPATETLAPGRVRHVLSDWDLDHAPHRAEVFRWTADGLARLSPTDAAVPTASAA